jgi:hypothetical protein
MLTTRNGQNCPDGFVELVNNDDVTIYRHTLSSSPMPQRNRINKKEAPRKHTQQERSTTGAYALLLTLLSWYSRSKVRKGPDDNKSTSSAQNSELHCIISYIYSYSDSRTSEIERKNKVQTRDHFLPMHTSGPFGRFSFFLNLQRKVTW